MQFETVGVHDVDLKKGALDFLVKFYHFLSAHLNMRQLDHNEIDILRRSEIADNGADDALGAQRRHAVAIGAIKQLVRLCHCRAGVRSRTFRTTLSVLQAFLHFAKALQNLRAHSESSNVTLVKQKLNVSSGKWKALANNGCQRRRDVG